MSGQHPLIFLCILPCILLWQGEKCFCKAIKLFFDAQSRVFEAMNILIFKKSGYICTNSTIAPLRGV